MSTATPHRSGQLRLLAGVILAVVLLSLLVLALDTSALTSALLNADPGLVALAVCVSLAAQLCWSLTTVWILRSIDGSLPRGRLQLAYLSGTFGKQVLPLGNVGGAAILTYVVAEDLDQRFRDVFAAVTASELLIFGSSVGVAALGLVGLVLDPVEGLDGPIVLAVLSITVAGLVAGTAVVAYRRHYLGHLVQQFAYILSLLVGRFSARLSRRLDPDRVARGVEVFMQSFERATDDTRRLATASVLGVFGWVAFGLALYYSFVAIGVEVPLGLALFMAPASGLATLLPTPGGLGSAEVGLTAAFSVLTPVSPELAAAAILLYRGVSYWLVISIGGLASLYLSLSVWTALE